METLKLRCDTSDENSFRSYILNILDKPVLLKGYLLQTTNKEKWKCLTWARRDWLKLLGSEPYPVQFGKRVKSTEILDFPQWEYMNFKGNMTYEEMLKWDKGETSFTTSRKTVVSQEEYWAYLDYYYIKDLTNTELADEVIDWDILDFPEIKAKDSTLWIGTKGANTPCHVDTYGSNIVCQIYGKKRWTLFPRDHAPYLYPTRLPYEESSIYSEVGFPKPNIVKFSKLASISPYLVTLEAGDVLLVPKHWWHFVENLDFSISINTWVPVLTDHDDRLKEALVLYQVGSLCQSLTCTVLLRSIFNSNMIDTLSMDSSELFQFLKTKVSLYIEEREHTRNQSHKESKRIKKDDASLQLNTDKLQTVDLQYVQQYKFEEYCSLVEIHPAINDGLRISDTDSKTDLESNITKLLINSFTDDRVMNTLKYVLDENIKKWE